MSDKCPKCGYPAANAEWRALLAPEHPADWPVYRCGSCFDPSGFCNREALTCLKRQLVQANAENERLRELLARCVKANDEGDYYNDVHVWAPAAEAAKEKP